MQSTFLTEKADGKHLTKVQLCSFGPTQLNRIIQREHTQLTHTWPGFYHRANLMLPHYTY